jgi:alpha-tubulin suppressor-like RCC1 family protein
MGACLAACVGCGATTTRAELPDAAVDGLDAPPIVPADGGAEVVDARRCDPSVLEDAGPAADVSLPDGPYVVELSFGGIHACARMSDGTLRCRGVNDHGQLGDGTTASAHGRPIQVDGIANAEQVVTVFNSTCARLRDGTVRCWGNNRYDQLGVGHEGDEPCRYDPREPLCRLRPVAVPGLTNVVQLAAGMFTYCAVRRDGDVWCWGSVGFPVRIAARSAPTPVRMVGLDDIVWMRATLTGWIARHRDGRYELFNTAPLPSIPADATVPSGNYNSHVCYVLPDTSMRCMGNNAFGKIGNGSSSYPERVTEPWDPGLCGVRSVVTGSVTTCALLADRRVWCWGDAERGPAGSTPTERCVGVLDAGGCVTRPTRVEGVDQVEQLFTGASITCAIRADRSVWCWGFVNVRYTEQPVRVEW